MKQIQPNITDVLTAKYIANLSRLRRFARYWGTATVNGVEVFVAKKHYYPDMDESTTKIAKFLGVYNDVKVKPEGVRSAWFHLSADKATDSTTDWDRTVLKNNLNLAFTKDLECSLVIGPKVQKKKQIPANIVTSVSDQLGVVAEIKSKYETLWDNGHTFFTSEDDPYLYLLVMYILRSDDVPYEIHEVQETVSSTYRPTAASMDGVRQTDQVPAWRVNLRIPHFVFTDTTDIIMLLAEDAADTTPVAALSQVRERLRTAVSETTSDDGDDQGKPDVVYEGMPTSTGGFWHTVTNTEGAYHKHKRYLKTSILTTPSLNTAEKLSYILSCVDTGYLKKKVKWYQVLVAIIIIVVSVIAANPAGVAAGTTLGTSAAVTAVVTIAVTITMASLYISLAALAANQLGAQNVALSLTQFLRAADPLIRLASVISFVTSIYGVIKEGIKRATAEAVKEGAKATLKGILVNTATLVVESLTGLTKLGNMTMSHITKMLSFTFDIYKDLASRDLQREINNYRREIASLAESEEKVRTSDVVKELMSSYPNLMARDWSYYTELYDRPYEWWATPYHTGNIQATTVNALWLNEPQNAILYNNSTGAS